MQLCSHTFEIEGISMRVAGAIPAADAQDVQNFLKPSENKTKRLLQTAGQEEAEL